MSVSVQTPYQKYTGNGMSTVFALPFGGDKQENILVSVDGLTQAYGVNYTVTALSESSGEITFTVAPGDGLEVIAWRETPIERPDDYAEHGVLPASGLNSDLDRMAYIVQENAARYDRLLDTVPDIQTVAENLDEIAAAADLVTTRVVDTAEDLSALDGSDQYAHVLGYWSKGDGGAGQYYYDDNELVWKLINTETLNTAQFGISGSNTAEQNAIALQGMIYDHPGSDIVVSGEFSVKGPIYLSGGNRLAGQNAAFTGNILGTLGSSITFTNDGEANDPDRIRKWATSTDYVENDIVVYGGAYYACMFGHTSGVFATDMGNGKWEEYRSSLCMQSGFAAFANDMANGNSGLLNTKISGLKIIGPLHGAAIHIGNSLNVEVSHCNIEQNRYGIAVESSINCSIRDNRFFKSSNANVAFIATGHPDISYDDTGGLWSGVWAWNDGHSVTGNLFLWGPLGGSLANILDGGSSSGPNRYIAHNTFYASGYSYTSPGAWSAAGRARYYEGELVTESGVRYYTPTTHDVLASFNVELSAGLWLRVTPDWATTTRYYRHDCVLQGGLFYYCLEHHESGTFSTDLASGKWQVGAEEKFLMPSNQYGYVGRSVAPTLVGNLFENIPYPIKLLDHNDSELYENGTLALAGVRVAEPNGEFLVSSIRDGWCSGGNIDTNTMQKAYVAMDVSGNRNTITVGGNIAYANSRPMGTTYLRSFQRPFIGSGARIVARSEQLVSGGYQQAPTYDFLYNGVLVDSAEQLRSYVPVLSSELGTIADYTVHSATYVRKGKLWQVNLDFDIDDKGTADGMLIVSLPATNVAFRGFFCGGRTGAVAAASLVIFCPAADGNMYIVQHGTGTAIADERYVITGTFEVEE